MEEQDPVRNFLSRKQSMLLFVALILFPVSNEVMSGLLLRFTDSYSTQVRAVLTFFTVVLLHTAVNFLPHVLVAKLNEIVQKDKGANAHVEFNQESKECEYVFIQTSSMRAAVRKFPEVLMLDSTYKINKNQMPVWVIEVMDGEGASQVVAYAILGNETKQLLTDMLLHFVEVSGGEEVFQKT